MLHEAPNSLTAAERNGAMSVASKATLGMRRTDSPLALAQVLVLVTYLQRPSVLQQRATTVTMSCARARYGSLPSGAGPSPIRRRQARRTSSCAPGSLQVDAHGPAVPPLPSHAHFVRLPQRTHLAKAHHLAALGPLDGDALAADDDRVRAHEAQRGGVLVRVQGGRRCR